VSEELIITQESLSLLYIYNSGDRRMANGRTPSSLNPQRLSPRAAGFLLGGVLDSRIETGIRRRRAFDRCADGLRFGGSLVRRAARKSKPSMIGK